MRREYAFKPVIRIDSKLKNRIKRKKTSDKRNILFDMPEWYIALIYRCTHCFYTGIEFSAENPLTLERIDNNKGYVVGNVIPVSRKANWAKSCFDIESLETHISNTKLKAEKYHIYINNVNKKISKLSRILKRSLKNGNDLESNIEIFKKIYKRKTDIERNLIAIERIKERIIISEMTLKASKCYSKMAPEGIILCLMYQQGFDPKIRFK